MDANAIAQLLLVHLNETTAERDAGRHELEKCRAELDVLSRQCDELARDLERYTDTRSKTETED